MWEGVDGETIANSYSLYLVKDKNGKTHLSEERSKVYQGIIDTAFDGVEKPEHGKQEVVIMGGGGGSGKSYLIKSQYIQVAPQSAKKAVHINPDDIKDGLPEYKQMLSSNDENVRKNAANFVQQESSIIAERIYSLAVAKGYSVVYDGTGSDMKQMERFTSQARKSGAVVKAYYVQAPIDVALKNAEKRYETEGRYVDPARLIEAHRKVSSNFEKMVEKGFFDETSLIQNDREHPLTTIATGKGKQLTVNNSEAYQSFMNKATNSK